MKPARPAYNAFLLGSWLHGYAPFPDNDRSRHIMALAWNQAAVNDSTHRTLLERDEHVTWVWVEVKA